MPENEFGPKQLLMGLVNHYLVGKIEDMKDEHPDMDYQSYCMINQVSVRYTEIQDGSRVDACMDLLEYGELDASFLVNIGR